MSLDPSSTFDLYIDQAITIAYRVQAYSLAEKHGVGSPVGAAAKRTNPKANSRGKSKAVKPSSLSSDNLKKWADKLTEVMLKQFGRCVDCAFHIPPGFTVEQHKTQQGGSW